MRRLIMSRLIWIYAVCKSLLLSPVAVKELMPDAQDVHCEQLLYNSLSPILHTFPLSVMILYRIYPK